LQKILQYKDSRLQPVEGTTHLEKLPFRKFHQRTNEKKNGSRFQKPGLLVFAILEETEPECRSA
jgi:hypothetical protein